MPLLLPGLCAPTFGMLHPFPTRPTHPRLPDVSLYPGASPAPPPEPGFLLLCLLPHLQCRVLITIPSVCSWVGVEEGVKSAQTPSGGSDSCHGPVDGPAGCCRGSFCPGQVSDSLGLAVNLKLAVCHPSSRGTSRGGDGGPGAWVSNRGSACTNEPKGLSYPEALLWGPLHSWVSLPFPGPAVP